MSLSRTQRGESLDISGLCFAQLLAYQRLINLTIDTSKKNLASNFPFPQVLEGSPIWRPKLKDIVGWHLAEAHIGHKNSPVATLIGNNTIFPNDMDYFHQYKSALIVFLSARNLYNVNSFFCAKF